MHDALVFTRTKHRANRLAKFLGDAGIKVERIHGNRSQAQRTEALAGFKSGKYRVLVATDIAARGIDVTALGHVVNFDVPHVAEDYIHRVGRTARAETTGSAFTLVSPEEEGDLRGIEKAIATRLPRVTLPDFDYNARAAAEPRSAAAAAAARSAQQGARPRSPGVPAAAGPSVARAAAAPLVRRATPPLMTEPAYPAARIVAPKVAAHFAQSRARRAAAAARTAGVAPPDADTIEAIIDAAFWASLRREESYVPKISLAFLPPGRGAIIRCCSSGRCRSQPDKLVKVAPAVERPGIHLGVWRNGDGLYVWGTVRTIPPLSFVVEVAAPGLLVVKHHRGDESGKFVNVAVLEGDQIKVVDERASSLPDCPPLLTSLLGFDSPASWVKGIDSVNVLVQLAVSMRAHGRGGLLLVVPAAATPLAGVDRPADSVRGRAAVRRARRAARAPRRDERRRGSWQDAVNRAVDAIAGLTAVDGATVLTNAYELLAFGAKIARRKGSPQVEQVTVTEPIEGDVAVTVHPTQLGGTRHLSAAQFVHDQQRRGGAGGVAGRALHGVRVVAVRGHGPRAPGRDAAAVADRPTSVLRASSRASSPRRRASSMARRTSCRCFR